MKGKQRLGVAVHEFGGTQSPLLLLLHANGFHGRVFLPMLPVFAPHFRCVALDLPGHGSAPTPDAPFTAEDLLGAVLDFVDSRGIQGCYCFGHSLGGAMAALLQCERPQTFRAMFLFEPVIRPFLDPSQGQVDNPQASGRERGPGPAGAPEAEASARRAPPPALPHPRASATGCGPSPSLLSSQSRGPPDSLLARMARKRQSVFPSLAAAKESLGAKPPFNTFHPLALHAYLACGGLRPLDSPAPAPTLAATTGVAGSPASPSAGAGADGGMASSCIDSVDGCLGAAAAAATLTLACAPENEARVFEALQSPPWRSWRRLTAASTGCTACGCDKDAAVGSRDGGAACDGRTGSSSSIKSNGEGTECRGQQMDGPADRQGQSPCRLAIAVGREEGLHVQLARWGAQVAELVPGAELTRFTSLNHLAPMEDPTTVAEAALAFFLADGGRSGDGAGAKENAAPPHAAGRSAAIAHSSRL